MSAKLMGKAFDVDLPTRQKFVLVAMADHADHDGTGVYPGHELLAEKTGYSKRSVTRAINELKDKGFIEKVANPEPQKKKATEYKIIPDNLSPENSTGETVSNKGDRTSGKNADTGDTVSSQPSSNSNRKENRNNSGACVKGVNIQSLVSFWNNQDGLTQTPQMPQPDLLDGITWLFEDEGWSEKDVRRAVENYAELKKEERIGINSSWDLYDFLNHKDGRTVYKIRNSPSNFDKDDTKDVDDGKSQPEPAYMRKVN
jgi:biotin operon repressor